MAQQNQDKIRVVGLGTQDSLALAESFVERHSTTTPLMVWDESFESWRYYGVSGQPVVIIVDQNGMIAGQWRGLPEEVVELVSQL